MTSNMEGDRDISLSAQELEYLRGFESLDESLAAVVTSQVSTHGHRITLRLNRAEAELLRDRLTLRLAEVGFDENYSPNAQGMLLEALIDRFFFR